MWNKEIQMLAVLSCLLWAAGSFAAQTQEPPKVVPLNQIPGQPPPQTGKAKPAVKDGEPNIPKVYQVTRDANKLGKWIAATYKPSIVTLTVKGDTHIFLTAPGKIHAEIAEKLKAVLVPAPKAGAEGLAEILNQGKNPKKAGPLTLEEAMATALKQNPDILVAEAKVREAEAELNRARQSVTAKIAAIHHDIAESQAILKEATAKLDRLKQLKGKGFASPDELGAVEATVQKYKAEVAKKEAELQYLIGKDTPPDTMRKVYWDQKPLAFSEYLEMVNPSPKAANIEIPNADKFRNALQTPINVNFDPKTTAKDAMEFLQQRSLNPKTGDGVNLLLSQDAGDVPLPAVRLPEPISLAATLQMIEDMTPIRFIVRDYGILGVNAKNIPPGALLLRDFVRHNPEMKGILPSKK